MALGALLWGQSVEERGNLLAQRLRRVVRPRSRQASDQAREEGVGSRRFIRAAPGLEPGLAAFARDRALQLADEPGLAEPGIADQAHDGAESLARLTERDAEGGKLVVPSNERPLVAGAGVGSTGFRLAPEHPIRGHRLVLALDLDAAQVLELEQRAD